MQNNQIESVINLLSGDNGSIEQLVNLAKKIKEESNTTQDTLTVQPDKHTDKLQLKINLINAIIPLLGEKATEQAQFLIKLLTIISAIKQLENSDKQ